MQNYIFDKKNYLFTKIKRFFRSEGYLKEKIIGILGVFMYFVGNLISMLADGKIDELAAAGKLDPALLLTMAKAYAAAKETDKTQEEVKDIMAHLYFKVQYCAVLLSTCRIDLCNSLSAQTCIVSWVAASAEYINAWQASCKLSAR